MLNSANWLFSLIVDLLITVFKGIVIGIASIIYGLISWFYQIFITVAQVNILSEGKIEGIYQRVTMIITIIMIFYITFEFVKYVVQPDSITDKESGVSKIFTKIIIAIILIAFVPRIFSIAYDLQNRVISNQVIPKIILGEEPGEDIKTLGSDFAASTMGIFLQTNPKACAADPARCSQAQQTIDTQLAQMRTNAEFGINWYRSDFSEKVKVDGENEYFIDFMWYLAIPVGIFILYILILYSIDLGTRYAQMIFLQIIAPIAIIGYIAPKKDNMFSKWTKQCITTYLDLFIRLFLIYFVLLLINVLQAAYKDPTSQLFKGLSDTKGVVTMVYIALIMGLLVFAHKAPKMLQDLFPFSGSASIGFGLGAKGRFEPTTKVFSSAIHGVSRVAGGIAGFATGIRGPLTTKNEMNNINKAWSAARAGYQGLRAGAAKQGGIRKGQQAAMKSYQEDIEVTDKGGTPLGRDFRGMHYQKESKEIKRTTSEKEDIVKSQETTSKVNKDMKLYKTFNTYKENWDNNNIGDANDRVVAGKDIEKAQRQFAASDRSNPAKLAVAEAELKKAIEASVNKIYVEAAGFADQKITSQNMDQQPNLTDKQKEMIKERETVINNLTNTIDSTSVKWNTVEREIRETMRLAGGQKYKVKDSSGNIIEKVVPTEEVIRELAERSGRTFDEVYREKLLEFAKDIGDVSDYASDEKGEIEKDAETRKANANANASKEK